MVFFNFWPVSSRARTAGLWWGARKGTHFLGDVFSSVAESRDAESVDAIWSSFFGISELADLKTHRRTVESVCCVYVSDTLKKKGKKIQLRSHQLHLMWSNFVYHFAIFSFTTDVCPYVFWLKVPARNICNKASTVSAIYSLYIELLIHSHNISIGLNALTIKFLIVVTPSWPALC